MKNYYYFILMIFLLTLFSCEVQLEKDTRILVKGLVQDQDNLPISNANIYITTRVYTGGTLLWPSGGEREYVFGEGYSKSDGNFSIVSLFDRDEDFAIEIEVGDDYSKYVYTNNTIDYTPLDLSFNLGTVTLKKMTNFNYNIFRTSGEENTIAVSIKYIEGDCLERYDGDILNENQSYCNEEQTLNRTLGDANPDFNGSIWVPLNEEIEFTYSINQEPEITEIITINQENYDYTFNY